MARLWQSGFELNSVSSGVEWSNTTGTAPAISTTTVRSGSYALRVNPSAATSRISYQFSSTGDNITYARVYMYIAAMPDSQMRVMDFVEDLGANFGIRLNTTGTLGLYDNNAGTQIGSNSTGLKFQTWYMLELFEDSTSLASSTGTARLDGVQFATGTANFTGLATQKFLTLGSYANVSADLFFDDVAINDNSGSSQNSWPNQGKLVHLKPSASGDANGFTVQVGGTAGAANNFTRVNEVTPDDTTSYNAAALLNAEDLFNCDNFTGGAFASINVVAVGVRFADLVAGDATTGVKLELLKVSGGTKTQSAQLVPNSTSFLTNAAVAPRNYPLVTYINPDGGEWTQAFLDSLQAGYINSAVGVQSIAISTIWISIDFTPALYGTTTSTSSTSSTSSSISTTSSSTSSTSTSFSSTSFSTSSTSSSLSTSSTSSSISSTSSSISSTSISSTSASTSISSTSSSISSTSISSTSRSTTSSSTSQSSTSSSFSSTSSSVSSTSRSTSSTSFSSTSSSSSVSTTTIPFPLDFSYEDKISLPTTAADLTNRFTSSQVGNVLGDDGDYFIEYGSEYMIRNYQFDYTNNTDSITFTWKGRSTQACTISPILIQIYNVNSAAWETLAINNTSPADTDFTATVTQSTNVSNYYDSSNIVTFRSYQRVI